MITIMVEGAQVGVTQDPSGNRLLVAQSPSGIRVMIPFEPLQAALVAKQLSGGRSSQPRMGENDRGES